MWYKNSFPMCVKSILLLGGHNFVFMYSKWEQGKFLFQIGLSLLAIKSKAQILRFKWQRRGESQLRFKLLKETEKLSGLYVELPRTQAFVFSCAGLLRGAKGHGRDEKWVFPIFVQPSLYGLRSLWNLPVALRSRKKTSAWVRGFTLRWLPN